MLWSMGPQRVRHDLVTLYNNNNNNKYVISKQSFTSFSIWIPFISFSSLIAVARNSKTLLNNSGKSGHPYPGPDLRGNAFSFSLLRIMFAVGLSYMAFIMLRYVPSAPTFWSVFIRN